MTDETEQAPSPQGELEPEQDQTLEETAALKAEAAELRDRLLRALAEVENTRRRADRDRQDASQYAIAAFARDMLSIYDNFGRALTACPADLRESAASQVKAVVDGIEATERQLLATLERYGVKPIDTSDGKFNPNLHQAIAKVPNSGKSAGAIVDVVQEGFVIGERLLRPAMVTVADGAAPAQKTEAGSSFDIKA
jgi:molecular chaperone GrpE